MNFESIQIIGLHGQAGVGKSTLATELERLGWTRISFATPLKEMVKAIGITDDDLNRKNEPAASAVFKGKTTRYLLQTLGTEWGRNKVSPTLWVDLATEKIKQLYMAGTRRIVIDDVRFPEEAEMIKNLGGLVVLIERQSGSDYGIKEEKERSHLSEKRLDDRYLTWIMQIAEGVSSAAEAARTLHEMSERHHQNLVKCCVRFCC